MHIKRRYYGFAAKQSGALAGYEDALLNEIQELKRLEAGKTRQNVREVPEQEILYSTCFFKGCPCAIFRCSKSPSYTISIRFITLIDLMFILAIKETTSVKLSLEIPYSKQALAPSVASPMFQKRLSNE